MSNVRASLASEPKCTCFKGYLPPLSLASSLLVHFLGEHVCAPQIITIVALLPIIFCL